MPEQTTERYKKVATLKVFAQMTFSPLTSNCLNRVKRVAPRRGYCTPFCFFSFFFFFFCYSMVRLLLSRRCFRLLDRGNDTFFFFSFNTRYSGEYVRFNQMFVQATNCLSFSKAVLFILSRYIFESFRNVFLDSTPQVLSMRVILGKHCNDKNL